MAVSAGSSDFESFLDQQLGAASGVYVPGGKPKMFAFLGSTARTARGRQTSADMNDNPKHSMFGGIDQIVDTDTASAQIYSWNSKKIKAWEKLLVDNGLLKPGDYSFGDLVQMWQGAVEESSKFQAAGKKVTPQDYVRMYAGMNGIGGKGANSGPTTTTSTERSVQDFTDLDARAMANEVFQNLLGKDAEGKNSAALEAALDAYAANHPQVTTRTQTVDANGNSTASTKSRGGITAGGTRQIAEDLAMSNPDYAEHQASTTLMNWLIQGIQAPVDV